MIVNFCAENYLNQKLPGYVLIIILYIAGDITSARNVGNSFGGIEKGLGLMKLGQKTFGKSEFDLDKKGSSGTDVGGSGSLILECVPVKTKLLSNVNALFY